MLPTIAFVTTCKGRVAHVEETLPANLEANRDYAPCKFVVLDYGSPDHLLEYLKTKHAVAIDAGRLVVYSLRDAGPFKMAHAKNMAHRLGILEGAEILCNLDADNFTGPDFARYIGESFDFFAGRSFLWAHMIKGKMARGISGRIVVTAHQFLNAGGYDEAFETWSPDDKDFNARLRRLGYSAVSIPPAYLLAINHNDKVRFREYPEARDNDYNEQQFCNVGAKATTIANWGNVGCGTVYRNFDFSRPITLRPIPTRIFGIGMHKTATTSLDWALKILGFDSAHWKSAHWAKAIWDQMTECGRSRAVEEHYAACDLPIPLLYQELDRAYPGSKFILTVRPEDEWLDSVRRHWSPEHNPFRHQWGNDPFTHKVHRLTYGQKGFDAELFLNRYRQHNEEVRCYFEERPGDLLVMDMQSGSGWYDLCPFLDVPVPRIPYPKAFAGKKQ